VDDEVYFGSEDGSVLFLAKNR